MHTVPPTNLLEKKISIIAPAYNESENIIPFYQRIKKTLLTLTTEWEIIFINDGSKDNTLEKLRNLYEEDSPHVKVIALSRNFGKEIALSAGLDYATGDAIIPIDTDLQDPPEIIPEMVSLWRQGYDVVYAIRTKREGESRIKSKVVSLFYTLLDQLSEVDIPSHAADFRLMDRRVVDALKQFRERHRFMKGLFSWVGYRQIGIPYQQSLRKSGRTSFGIFKLWHFAIEGITSFSTAPLRLSMYTGMGIASGAFIYMLVILFKTLFFGESVQGYPSMMSVILFLGGVQLMSIGVMGEYIGRIYNEVKGRPLYLIDKIYQTKDDVASKN